MQHTPQTLSEDPDPALYVALRHKAVILEQELELAFVHTEEYKDLEKIPRLRNSIPVSCLEPAQFGFLMSVPLTLPNETRLLFCLQIQQFPSFNGSFASRRLPRAHPIQNGVT